MKIVLSTRRFGPPFMGGVDVYAERLGRALRELGHEVAYLAFDSSRPGDSPAIETSEAAYEGSRVRRFHFAMNGRSPRALAVGYDPQMGDAVRDALRAERPDLFIILNFYLVTLAAIEAACDLGIPIAHIATDFVPVCRRATLIQWDGQSCRSGESVADCARCFVSEQPLGRAAARLMDALPETAVQALAGPYSGPHPLRVLNPYWRQVRLMEERLAHLDALRRQVDVVVAPTRYTADAFAANGFPAERVHVLPFGVEPDHPLATVRHTPPDHLRFLFVGRLQPYKGAHLLVEAFNALQRPRGATLTIVGGAAGHDAYLAKLKAMTAGNERIRFAGTVPPSALGDLFAAADYFVLPSTWHENSPLILLDALQSRTPVIAADIGGVRDVVEHDVNGWLFPMGSSVALGRLLQQAIDTPQRVAALRAGIRLPSIFDYARELLALCGHQPIVAPPAASPVVAAEGD